MEFLNFRCKYRKSAKNTRHSLHFISLMEFAFKHGNGDRGIGMGMGMGMPFYFATCHMGPQINLSSCCSLAVSPK